MNQPKPRKCVIVVDKALPIGLLANATAVLGVSLGRLAIESVGPDVDDAAGVSHRGITTIPIAVLGATSADVLAIASAARALSDVVVVDFTDAAQTSKSYADYTTGTRSDAELRYLAVLLYGDKAAITQLTSSLPLLR